MVLHPPAGSTAAKMQESICKFHLRTVTAFWLLTGMHTPRPIPHALCGLLTVLLVSSKYRFTSLAQRKKGLSADLFLVQFELIGFLACELGLEGLQYCVICL